MHCILVLVVALTLSCTSFAQPPKVKTGIEVLRESGFGLLRGKRVGVITNPTGVDSKLKSTIDILFASKVVHLVALFGPEHGVRGNIPAGEKIDNSVDSLTGLPAYSLYGKTRKPTPEMLKGIEVLVYDIQDIGIRSYTYISTMGLAMEAAAEHGIAFVVLDRPNPLGGLKVEGNIVERGFESFVGQYPIPYIYGLTCGELATLLNGEKLLSSGKKCSLTVVPMKGWKRTMTFEETGLPWVPTSPHIPEATTPAYCASTGIAGELGVFSEGVGTPLPFRLFAAEWINAQRFATALNALNIAGLLFRPISFTPSYGRFKDRNLHGVQIFITDLQRASLMSIQFLCLQVHHELYPERNPFSMADSLHLAMFDKVCGTDQVRKRFARRMKFPDIKKFLEKDVRSFRKTSSRYYLY